MTAHNTAMLQNNKVDKITPFSILDFSEIVVIDTETTGLNPVNDEIIEIAAVKFSKNSGETTFSSFVKPVGEVPHYIEYLTNITHEDLQNAPVPEMVLTKFKDFVGNSIIVGQNTKFDLDFINTKLIDIDQLPLLNQWWDTAELGRIYLPFASNHKLTTLCSEFGIELSHSHRAIYDAQATGALFFKLIEFIFTHYKITINARIAALARQAQLDSNLAILLDLVVNHQRKYSLVNILPQKMVNYKSNIIDNKCLQPRITSQYDIFFENGVLSNNFEQYEFRNGQLDMAESVEKAFSANCYLLAEAGTGVGKSFAYLIPALQFAYSKSKKVIVSTNTKNLQEQLFHKDLPILKKIVQVPFKAVLVKGRENYICERKWEEILEEQSRGLTPYEASGLLYLLIWKQGTLTGDITENSSFDRNRFNIVWRRLGSDRHYCAGRKCAHFGRCYVMQLRKNVETADLVVINHSLLLADLQSDHASLGEYEHLIIDEAHNIIQTASHQLGIEINYSEIISQINQISKLYKNKNIAFIDQLDKAIRKSVLPESTKEHIGFICKNIEEAIETNRKLVFSFFEYITSECEKKGSFSKLRIKSVSDFPSIFEQLIKLSQFWKTMLKEIHALSNMFSGLNAKQVPAYDILLERIQGIELRAVESENDILSLLNPDLENYTFWLENAPKSEKNLPNCSVCYAPIEVNEQLCKLVYNNVPSIVFTSATLALRGSFKFFKHQAGIDLITKTKVYEKVVDSPFDYHTQSRLYVAGFLPEPEDANFFLPQALDVISSIIESTPVGTLALFTSYKDLDAAYGKMNEILYQKNRPLFAQGKWSSRSALLDEFKKHNNAVLFGTASFWEGIDVQGESLSLLILFKLPFQVPTEPVVEAYIEKLDKSNINSFMHYMLPNALLRLRQGFGRLIRSRSDTGVVIIMDPRVATKRYGHYFQEVLPSTSIVVNDPLQLQSSVIEFFKQRHSYYRQ